MGAGRWVLLVLSVMIMMVMCGSAAKENRGEMTVNSFEKGGDGGGPSACDGKFHPNKKHWVALPTGIFNNKKNCFRKIKISAKGKSTVATVIDECAGSCKFIDASESVWFALGIHRGDTDFGLIPITWHFL